MKKTKRNKNEEENLFKNILLTESSNSRKKSKSPLKNKKSTINKENEIQIEELNLSEIMLDFENAFYTLEKKKTEFFTRLKQMFFAFFEKLVTNRNSEIVNLEKKIQKKIESLKKTKQKKILQEIYLEIENFDFKELKNNFDIFFEKLNLENFNLFNKNLFGINQNYNLDQKEYQIDNRILLSYVEYNFQSSKNTSKNKLKEKKEPQKQKTIFNLEDQKNINDRVFSDNKILTSKKNDNFNTLKEISFQRQKDSSNQKSFKKQAEVPPQSRFTFNKRKNIISSYKNNFLINNKKESNIESIGNTSSLNEDQSQLNSNEEVSVSFSLSLKEKTENNSYLSSDKNQSDSEIIFEKNKDFATKKKFDNDQKYFLNLNYLDKQKKNNKKDTNLNFTLKNNDKNIDQQIKEINSGNNNKNLKDNNLDKYNKSSKYDKKENNFLNKYCENSKKREDHKKRNMLYLNKTPKELSQKIKKNNNNNNIGEHSENDTLIISKKKEFHNENKKNTENGITLKKKKLNNEKDFSEEIKEKTKNESSGNFTLYHNNEIGNSVNDVSYDLSSNTSFIKYMKNQNYNSKHLIEQANLSDNEKNISENLSDDNKNISENLSDNNKSISKNLSDWEQKSFENSRRGNISKNLLINFEENLPQEIYKKNEFQYIKKNNKIKNPKNSKQKNKKINEESYSESSFSKNELEIKKTNKHESKKSEESDLINDDFKIFQNEINATKQIGKSIRVDFLQKDKNFKSDHFLEKKLKKSFKNKTTTENNFDEKIKEKDNLYKIFEKLEKKAEKKMEFNHLNITDSILFQILEKKNIFDDCIELNFENNIITDKGVSNLLEKLKKNSNSKLYTLNLLKNNLTIKSLYFFLDFFSQKKDSQLKNIEINFKEPLNDELKEKIEELKLKFKINFYF